MHLNVANISLLSPVITCYHLSSPVRQLHISPSSAGSQIGVSRQLSGISLIT
jgi:hypothetical protein